MERATHLLLATTDDNLRAGGGRELLSRLLHAVLAELFDRVTIVRFTGRTTALNALQGRLNGIERHSAACAADPSITHALIDGSNLGALAWQIRRARPGLPVSCFFHNCETRFFQDAFAAAPGPRALAVLAGHWRAERRAVRGSQRLITLSERDSDELARRHGRGADVRGARHLPPQRQPRVDRRARVAGPRARRRGLTQLAARSSYSNVYSCTPVEMSIDANPDKPVSSSVPLSGTTMITSDGLPRSIVPLCCSANEPRLPSSVPSTRSIAT